jgi:hypothetical protein
MLRFVLNVLLVLACLGIAEYQQATDRPSPPNTKHEKQQPTKPNANGEKGTGTEPRPTVSAPPSNPAATTEHGSDIREARANADWWLAAFTGALVLFTAALAVVGYFQYRTLCHHEDWMRQNVEVVTKIAEAAASSAKTAKDSLTITDERLRASNEAAIANAKAAQLNAQAVINAERPWIGVSVNARQGTQQYEFIATNYGRTPAEILSANTKWTTAVDDAKELAVPPDYGTDVLSYRRLLPQMKTWEFHVENIDDKFRSTPELREDRLLLVLYGCVKYNDMLDSAGVHETRFCYRFLRKQGYWVLAGPEQYNQRT